MARVVLKVLCGTDMRRVALEDPFAVRFGELVQSIEDLFNGADGNVPGPPTYALQYQDDEEDWVGLSCDEEWQESLRVVKQRTVTSPASPSSSSPSQLRPIRMRLVALDALRSCVRIQTTNEMVTAALKSEAAGDRLARVLLDLLNKYPLPIESMEPELRAVIETLRPLRKLLETRVSCCEHDRPFPSPSSSFVSSAVCSPSPPSCFPEEDNPRHRVERARAARGEEAATWLRGRLNGRTLAAGAAGEGVPSPTAPRLGGNVLGSPSGPSGPSEPASSTTSPSSSVVVEPPTTDPTSSTASDSQPTGPAPAPAPAPDPSPSTAPATSEDPIEIKRPSEPRMHLVGNASLPDGTRVQGGAKYVKAWRVQNGGDVAWPADVSLHFVGGDRLGCADITPVEPAAPGAEVDILLPIVAPRARGRYHGYWELRSGGVAMGHVLWVDVKVGDEIHAAALDQLREMGFENDDRNLQILLSHGGDVSRTIAELLERKSGTKK